VCVCVCVCVQKLQFIAKKKSVYAHMRWFFCKCKVSLIQRMMVGPVRTSLNLHKELWMTFRGFKLLSEVFW